MQKKTIEERVGYIKDNLPKCKGKADIDLKSSFDNTAAFMSEMCNCEFYLERNFSYVLIKNRGIPVSDMESFYNSAKVSGGLLISRNSQNVTYEVLKYCEELKRKKNSAVKNLGEINKFDKIFSQAYEMLRILLDLLKQKKSRVIDSVDKAIGELDKAKINFPSKKNWNRIG